MGSHNVARLRMATGRGWPAACYVVYIKAVNQPMIPHASWVLYNRVCEIRAIQLVSLRFGQPLLGIHVYTELQSGFFKVYVL